MARHYPTVDTPEEARSRSRPAVILAALLYLIATYQRTPCPYVALCIVQHLDCLADHPDADPVIRQICAAVRTTWGQAAASGKPARAAQASPMQRICALLH